MGNPSINFFWSGDDWTYLHDLTIKSHIVVDNTPIIWIHGNIPNSIYWDNDLYQRYCIIENANDIFDVSGFLKNGGNFKTASSLWRFTLLYEQGGWYADTDALAMSRWDEEGIVLCEDSNGLYVTGVLKVPPKLDMFNTMKKHIKKEWGNVHVFNRYCTVQSKSLFDQYFPYEWQQWDTILKKPSFDMYKLYSIHLYHTMFERANMIDNIDEWIRNNKNTMLSLVDKHIKGQI